jgi:drug/metabolite transporter (DMT)-like permease
LLLCASLHLLAIRHTLEMKWTAIGVVAAAALLSYVGNLLYIKAVTLAPNPGYPVAIEGNKAVLVLVASCLFFGAEFTPGKLIGILLCLAGVFLIAR